MNTKPCVAARDFVARAVLPIADRLDRAGQEIPDATFRQLGQLGYLGLTVPLEYDGVGMQHLSMAIVAEELSRGWLSVGSVMTRNLPSPILVYLHARIRLELTPLSIPLLQGDSLSVDVLVWQCRPRLTAEISPAWVEYQVATHRNGGVVADENP